MLIDSREALLALSQHLGSQGVAEDGRLVVRFAELPAAENASIEAQLNRLYRPCGCDWAAGLAVAVPATFALYLQFTQSTVSISTAAIMVGLFLAGGAIGKAIGLFIAREQLRRKLRSLLASISRT